MMRFSLPAMVFALLLGGCSQEAMQSISTEQKNYLNENSILSSEAPLSTLEDTKLSANVASYSDPKGRIKYQLVKSPVLGTLLSFDEASGNFEYMPKANLSGGDSLEVVAVVDGSYKSEPKKVSIEVMPVNDKPVANIQNLIMNEDNSISARLVGSDVENSPLKFSISVMPKKGTATLAADGSLTFVPNKDANGADSLSFVVNDGGLNSDPAVVSITINPVNDLPVAMDGNLNTNEDVAVNGKLNAADADGDALVYEIVAMPAKGVIQNLVASSGTFTYQPNLNTVGMDSFTFRAKDAAGNSNTATVSVNLNNVNDLPVAQNVSVSTNEDVALDGNANASDADGDMLTYSVVTSPTKGSVTFTGKAFRYVPMANANGSDSFTYRANDGMAFSNNATVSINIVAVNDAPVVNAVSISATAGVAKAGSFSGSDIEGSALTYVIVTQPSKGTVTVSGSGFTYTAAASQSGSDSFTYRASDGSLSSNTATVSISIMAAPTTMGTATLTWDPNGETDLQSYNVYRGTSATSLALIKSGVAKMSAPSYVDSTGIRGTTYYYAVTAVNPAGESDKSNIYMFKIP
jgi:hypothetical protein